LVCNQDYVSGVGGKLAGDYGIASDWLVRRIGGRPVVTNASFPNKATLMDGPLQARLCVFPLQPRSSLQLGGFKPPERENRALFLFPECGSGGGL